ncbi:MAG: methyltransferase domain-containing protein [Candidatus Competibacter sp.]|nr:methyltransferase domain-containing protein [Candidatus Competibacter sp.]MDG4606752.1 methyltransferase domain-containing protein [Candidatus Contendobacter sp.]HRD48886.1 methyltransferase domain-containing protein [Candidatus Contendobacter sp.]
MSRDPLSDVKIVESWGKNALPWTKAVRDGQIDSRRLITNQAIVEAVLSRSPRTVLDLGCGEGWLTRELAARQIQVTGVDAVPDLIEKAQSAGGGDFRVASYEEIAAGKLKISVDVMVCNFALLGHKSVEAMFRAAPSLLNAHGALIIQTLHPIMACGDFPYQDGWREGSWTGFSADFTDPAPWYFRTMESWIKLFRDSGFQLLEVREPVHPKTRKPASVIFIAEVADRVFALASKPDLRDTDSAQHGVPARFTSQPATS